MDDRVEYMGLCGDELGATHVVYPTALRTLCLRERFDESFQYVDPRVLSIGATPDCLACWNVVRVWSDIFGSGIPRSWLAHFHHEVIVR